MHTPAPTVSLSMLGVPVSNSVYIVEDHPRMRDLLREWIDDLPGLSVCGTAESAETALRELETVQADVAMIDMSLPLMGGIELVAALRERHPQTRCLILSGHNETSYVERALAAGAQGYLLKGEPSEIQTAISRVLAGERYLSAGLPDRSCGLSEA